jgi:hypothetical protein
MGLSREVRDGICQAARRAKKITRQGKSGAAATLYTTFVVIRKDITAQGTIAAGESLMAIM